MSGGRGPRLWPFYVGGFLGPFGGAVTTPMLPELADGLGTSVTTAAAAMTAYLLPFAALMLVSGTLAEQWGRARSVQVAYVVYAAASLVCALAPGIGVFLAGRALQGSANAFTSPLLVAAISDAVPRSGLGRALGRYGALQAAGQAFAPLVGGVAGAVDWRLAFVTSAVVAGALAFAPPRDHPRDDDEEPLSAGQRWRALANARLARACGVAFGLYLSTSGLMLLVALLAGDRFGLDPEQRGLVVAAFGVTGLAAGGLLGRLADRLGLRRFGTVALLAFAGLTAAAGWSPAVWALVAAMALGGAASTAGRVVVNTLAVTSTPANRGGATSMTLSWQFLGSALAPVALLPAYAADAGLGFVLTAVGALVGAAVVAAAPVRR